MVVSKDLVIPTDLTECACCVSALDCRIVPLHKASAKMVSSWTVCAVCALLVCLGCVMRAATADDVTGEAESLRFVFVRPDPVIRLLFEWLQNNISIWV
jgi:hypothetical protein